MLNSLPEAIGLTRGGSLRAALDRLMCGLGLGNCPDCPTKTNTIAFTVAIVALGAKLAKADGFVSHVETETFHKVFQTPEAQSANVQRLYDLAKQDVTGFESYARQIADLLANEPELKRDVLEGPFFASMYIMRATDIAPDGTRFLMLTEPPELRFELEPVVVLDWFPELLRQVPASAR